MNIYIRLQKNKKNKLISYNIVVIQKYRSVNSRYVEKIGNYNIHNKFIIFNLDLYKKWIARGAIISDSVNELFKRYNISILQK